MANPSSPGGVIGNWKPQYPEDPYGTQIFQGGKDWNLTKTGPAQGVIPYYQTYGGQNAPYADSTAQILDAMMYSGVMGKTPDNPLMSRTAGYKPGDPWSWDPNGPHEVAPNQAGRYSFGGGGGYGGAYGLLGGRTRPPGVPAGGGRLQPQGAPGGPPPGAQISTGDNFPGLPQNGAPQSTPSTQGQNWGVSNLLPPSQPLSAQHQMLAEIENAGGPVLNESFGSAQDRGRAITATGSFGTLYNPSRIAAISQMLAGSTPEQVMNNPMMGAAGGNYYNLDGTSTGLNPGAAPLGATAGSTNLGYLQGIAGLLGSGR